PVAGSVSPAPTLRGGGVRSSLWEQKAMRTRFAKAAPSRTRRWSVMAGSWLGARRAPFRRVWNRELFAAATRVVDIPVFAVGGIRTAAEAEAIVARGEADMIGIGRPFYAEPDLAARILGESAPDTPGLCESSNLCVPAQLLGMKGVCYNPAVRKKGQ